jgi:SAM-dependent methyltransferase
VWLLPFYPPRSCHDHPIEVPGATGCCGGGSGGSERLGYSADDLAAVPSGADLGLGCGNPQAIAGLRAGEVVVDLGAGGGFDCFLAARAVGPTGRVIGVDMSTDMIALARANAAKQAIGACCTPVCCK